MINTHPITPPGMGIIDRIEVHKGSPSPNGFNKKFKIIAKVVNAK